MKKVPGHLAERSTSRSTMVLICTVVTPARSWQCLRDTTKLVSIHLPITVQPSHVTATRFYTFQLLASQLITYSEAVVTLYASLSRKGLPPIYEVGLYSQLDAYVTARKTLFKRFCSCSMDLKYTLGIILNSASGDDKRCHGKMSLSWLNPSEVESRAQVDVRADMQGTTISSHMHLQYSVSRLSE
jgi:hypothetical protein